MRCAILKQGKTALILEMVALSFVELHQREHSQATLESVSEIIQLPAGMYRTHRLYCPHDSNNTIIYYDNYDTPVYGTQRVLLQNENGRQELLLLRRWTVAEVGCFEKARTYEKRNISKVVNEEMSEGVTDEKKEA